MITTHVKMIAVVSAKPLRLLDSRSMLCMALQPHLLVEDHVHAMGLDVDRVLPHELQDVLDASRVGQASEADAVASAAGRREEGSRGEHRHGHDGWRRERGDKRSGHVAVQHLENVKKKKKKNKTNRVKFEYIQWTQNFWLGLNMSRDRGWAFENKNPWTQSCQYI